MFLFHDYWGLLELKGLICLFYKVLPTELGDELCPALAKTDHFARAVNRLRQSMRPRDPLDLEFDLNHDFVPDCFLKGDIQKHGKRHLIFTADQQLAHLSKAKSVGV